MTRNCENASTVRPGNSDARWARIMLDSRTNPCRPALHSASGSRITRGNARGTLTMAMRFSRPKASRPPSRTMKFRLLLATSGNGCAGSSPTGTSSGRTCDSKNLPTQRCCAALRCTWLMISMPARSQRRPHLLVEQAVLRIDQRMRGGGQVVHVALRRGVVRGPHHLEVVGEANLEEFVQVRRHDGDVAQAFEQGHVGAFGLRQHAAVERQDRLLAIEQVRRPLGHDHATGVGFAASASLVGHAASLWAICNRRVTAAAMHPLNGASPRRRRRHRPQMPMCT